MMVRLYLTILTTPDIGGIANIASTASIAKNAKIGNCQNLPAVEEGSATFGRCWACGWGHFAATFGGRF
jgi:hypothetical protein